MEFNPEVLNALLIFFNNFSGEKILEMIDISDNKIKNEGKNQKYYNLLGLSIIGGHSKWMLKKINILHLKMRSN